LEIVKQGCPWRIWGRLSRDQNVVHAGQAVLWQKLARGFAQSPAGPIADNGAADPLCRRQPQPHGPAFLPALGSAAKYLETQRFVQLVTGGHK